MNTGRSVFAQLTDLVPRPAFDLAGARHHGEQRPLKLSCRDQLLCMLFAQSTARSSLRETTTCLRALPSSLSHLGIRTLPARSTLADANEQRDHRIFMDTALSMIATARIALLVNPETGKRLIFLTNRLELDPVTVALLYRKRWHIELLFKWMKQHLRIKAFFGTTPNAVQLQLWVAGIALVIIHRVKHLHGPKHSPNEIAQILGLTLLENTPVKAEFFDAKTQYQNLLDRKQLPLFDLWTDSR